MKYKLFAKNNSQIKKDFWEFFSSFPLECAKPTELASRGLFLLFFNSYLQFIEVGLGFSDCRGRRLTEKSEREVTTVFWTACNNISIKN